MAQRFIEPPCRLTKRIPGILSGVLFSFFSLFASATETDLAEQLFQEGNWPVCLQESQRVLCQSPYNETALLLHTLASLRSSPTNINGNLSALISLTRNSHHPEIRAVAANEAAWILARQDRMQEAWRLAEQAFLGSTSTPVFRSSGALLLEIMARHPKMAAPSDTTRLQIETCAPLLANAPIPPRSLDPLPQKTSLLAMPGQWIVFFYRNAIRPALGARCSLKPHCSEYFLLASRQHPLLAIPMIADRLVREPSVVSAGQHALQENGTTVYEDPVENHDFWMTSRP